MALHHGACKAEGCLTTSAIVSTHEHGPGSRSFLRRTVTAPRLPWAREGLRRPDATMGCVGSGVNPRSAPTTQAAPACAGGPRADRIGTIEQKPDGEINAIARADPWTPTRPHASASCRESHHSLNRRGPLRAKHAMHAWHRQGRLATCANRPKGRQRVRFAKKRTLRRDPKHFWLEGIRLRPDDDLSTGCEQDVDMSSAPFQTPTASFPDGED